ncbi:MAG: ACT domain-containing protein [Sphingomonadales bacterium]|nr:ACT domain-containing protein [Sphingomonadales bacterium]
MTTRIILTVLGSDRPGLTQALAEAVLAAGGNWLDSHLARLGGKYVGSVLVEVADDRLETLEGAVRTIDASGLQVVIVPAGEAAPVGGESGWVELVGQDRPGIVREVTSVLADLGANIEQFTSRTENSAWSGELLFRARMRLEPPAGLSWDAVREALEAISGEIMVDLTFNPRTVS